MTEAVAAREKGQKIDAAAIVAIYAANPRFEPCLRTINKQSEDLLAAKEITEEQREVTRTTVRDVFEALQSHRKQEAALASTSTGSRVWNWITSNGTTAANR